MFGKFKILAVVGALAVAGVAAQSARADGVSAGITAAPTYTTPPAPAAAPYTPTYGYPPTAIYPPPPTVVYPSPVYGGPVYYYPQPVYYPPYYSQPVFGFGFNWHFGGGHDNHGWHGHR